MQVGLSACAVAQEHRTLLVVLSFVAVLYVLVFACPCKSANKRKSLASMGILIFVMVGMAAFKTPLEIQGVPGFLLALGAGCVIFPVYHWIATRFYDTENPLSRSKLSTLQHIFDLLKLSTVSLGLLVAALYQLLVLAQGFWGMAETASQFNCTESGDQVGFVWIGLIGISMTVALWSEHFLTDISKLPFRFKLFLFPCVYVWVNMIHRPEELTFYPGYHTALASLTRNDTKLEKACEQQLRNFTGECLNSTVERKCLDTWRCRQPESFVCSCCLDGCLECNHLTALQQCRSLSWTMITAAAAERNEKMEVGLYQFAAAEDSGALRNVTSNFCELGHCRDTNMTTTSPLTQDHFPCLACMTAVEVVKEMAADQLFHRNVGELFVLFVFTLSRVASWYALGLFVWLLLRRVSRGSGSGDALTRALHSARSWRKEVILRDEWIDTPSGRSPGVRRAFPGVDEEDNLELRFRLGVRKQIEDFILLPFQMPLLLITGAVYWIGALWASDRFCEAMSDTWQTGDTLLLMFKSRKASLNQEISLCDMSWELSFHALTAALIVSFMIFGMLTCNSCNSRTMLWHWLKCFVSLLAGLMLVVVEISHHRPASERLFEWLGFQVPITSFAFFSSTWRSVVSIVCLVLFIGAVLKDFTIVGRSELVIGARLGQASFVLWRTIGVEWSVTVYLLIFLVVKLDSLRSEIIWGANVQKRFLKELSYACSRDAKKRSARAPADDDEDSTDVIWQAPDHSMRSLDLDARPGEVKLQSLAELLLSVTLYRPAGWWLWPVLAGPAGRLRSARPLLTEALSIFEHADDEINNLMAAATQHLESDHWSLDAVIDAIAQGRMGEVGNPEISAKGLALSGERRLYEAASVLEYVAAVIGQGVGDVKGVVSRVFEHREILILVEAHSIFSRLSARCNEPSRLSLSDAAVAAEQWERLQSCESLQEKLAQGAPLYAHNFMNEWRDQLQDCLRQAAKQAVKESDRDVRHTALAEVLSAAGQSKRQLGLDIESLQKLKQEVLEEELQSALHEGARDLWEVSFARSLRLHRLIAPDDKRSWSDATLQLLRPAMRHLLLWCKQLKEEQKSEAEAASLRDRPSWFDETTTRVLADAVTDVMSKDGIIGLRNRQHERGMAAICLAVSLQLNMSPEADSGDPPGDSASTSSQVQPSLIGKLSGRLLSEQGGIAVDQFTSWLWPGAAESVGNYVPATHFICFILQQLITACEQRLWDVAQVAVEASDDLLALLHVDPGAEPAFHEFLAAFHNQRAWFDAEALRDLQTARTSSLQINAWERVLGLYTAVCPLRGCSSLDSAALLEEVQLVVRGADHDQEATEEFEQYTASRIKSSSSFTRMWNWWGTGSTGPKNASEASEEGLTEQRAIAICWLCMMGHSYLTEACDRDDQYKLRQALANADEALPAAKLRMSLQHGWEDGLLQGLLESEGEASFRIPPGLRQKAREKICTLHSLPPDVDLSALFMSRSSRQSVRMAGLGRLSSLGDGVLEAQVLDSKLPMFQHLMNETYRAVLTKDRRDGAVPEKYEVVKVIKIFNAKTYQGYLGRLDSVEQELQESGCTLTDYDMMTAERCKQIAHEFEVPPLHESGLEGFLFHGTKPEGARSIAIDDFDLKFARDGLFGRGIYLAESCSKSDEYTSADKDGLRPLLLCRVVLGQIYYCEQRCPNKRDLEVACTTGGYHSVLGDRRKVHNTFREFIIYDPLQVCTHFVIWYRRR